MEAGIPIQVLLPLVIAAMMLGVGMSLRITDFTALLTTPLSAVIGLLSMFLIFPGLSFLIAGSYPLSMELQIGLVLLAASPSASTSTLFTYLARGDAALSLTLTAISKLLPVITIPLYIGLAARLFASTDTTLDLRLEMISERLVQMVLLPTLAGMALQHFRPRFADRIRPAVIRIAVIALILLIAALVFRERHKLPDMLLQAGPAALTLCLAGMACAYLLARVTRLQPRQNTAIVIETGMQSGGTAIAIAAGILAVPAMAVPAAVYSLIMYLVTAMFVHLKRSGKFHLVHTRPEGPLDT
ncbi:bile acid:sodium symporter family protein [Sedimenticola sp.]|uniref:bile acid:sodium symporter family protein n=1 Tax=Sedimenticola sp. TaxID=1940285 RepID=UPI00258A11C1|nr:bile acid:sodium symporter [Sedimenticola sp.]MCW8903709.1 bile acid:sodium symporter [Sedimenticola sp.]